MKERGKYQIQCMKSRSSTGVGQKIDLEYNIDTMRITDAGGDENENSGRGPKPSLMDSIKARASVSATESTEGAVKWERPQPAEGHDPLDPTPRTPTVRVSADVQSAKLKQLLGKIKTS
jgi:hypothetical protein